MTKISDERRTDRELSDMIQSLLNHGEAGYTYVKIDAHLSALRELQSLRSQPEPAGVREAARNLMWMLMADGDTPALLTPDGIDPNDFANAYADLENALSALTEQQGEAVADPTYRSPREDAAYYGSIWSLTTNQMAELEKTFEYHRDHRPSFGADYPGGALSIEQSTLHPLADREKSAALTEPKGEDHESDAAAIEIADAVIAWMVRHDLLDADLEYRDDEIIAVLDELSPGLATTNDEAFASPLTSPSNQEPAAVTDRQGIYIASKVKHADRWRTLRDDYGDPIISTWIDEAGVGESASLEDLWRRCVHEASTAAALIIYCEPDEVLKGAWVELGAALASGVPVFAVGIEKFTVANHAGITHCGTMAEARRLAAALSQTQGE